MDRSPHRRNTGGPMAVTLRIMLRSLRGALFVAPIGYVAGLAAMGIILPGWNDSWDENGAQYHALNPHDVVVAAIVTMVLGSIAGGIGSLPRHPIATAGATFAASIGMALLCTPVTFIALGGLPDHGIGSVAMMLIAATMLGAFVSVPAGCVFSFTYSVLLGAVAWAERGGARARRAVIAIIVGAIWAAVGLSLASLRGASLPLVLGISAANLLAVLGLAVFLVGTIRVIATIVWLARVCRGEVPSYRIDEADEHNALAPMLPWGKNDGVLVRVEDQYRGPFRSGETVSAIARASLG
jgi:hypothetical protein